MKFDEQIIFFEIKHYCNNIFIEIKVHIIASKELKDCINNLFYSLKNI